MPQAVKISGDEKFEAVFPASVLKNAASAVSGKALKEAETLDQTALSGFILNALGDESASVRAAAHYVGALIQKDTVMTVLENYIDTDGNGEADLDRADRAAAGIAIVMGKLAKRSGDRTFTKNAENRICNLLYCPSDLVKKCAADGLSQVVQAIPADEAKAILDSFVKDLPGSDPKAAAFGIAGCVKGLGSRSLRSHGVLTTLEAALDDKKNNKLREGALWAYSALSVTLSHVFEPYAAHAIPTILNKFGDKTTEVRTAAEAALQSCMNIICAQGVSLLIPRIVSVLDSRSTWQTSVACLGCIAGRVKCARNQLANSISIIMPSFIEALSDTKPEVQEATKKAISALAADLITSPEMKAMVPALLQAIFSPGEETMPCVEKLMDVTFVNPIDGPCLSLMVPVVSRALKERRVEFKRRSSLVVGNMCALVIDGRALIPYVPFLLPELAACVKDSNPEMRQYGASALAALLKGMASAHLSQRFENLVAELDRLQRDMVSDKAEVRAAAEQGLQELIDLAAAQATKTDHTEAEVAEDLERMRLEEIAKAEAEAAAKVAEAEAAARREAGEGEDGEVASTNFLLQKQAALAEQEEKDKVARKEEEKRLREEAKVKAEEDKKKAFEKFQKDQKEAMLKHQRAKKKK